MKETGALHKSDTIQFDNHTVCLPSPTPTDCIVAATKHLKNSIDQATPLTTEDELSAIEHIRTHILSPPTLLNTMIPTNYPITTTTMPVTPILPQ